MVQCIIMVSGLGLIDNNVVSGIFLQRYCSQAPQIPGYRPVGHNTVS